MSIAAASLERLFEVSRLTETLTDQVLEAQILHDHNLPWWATLTQALHGLSRKPDEAAPENTTQVEGLKGIELVILSFSFASFRKDKP